MTEPENQCKAPDAGVSAVEVVLLTPLIVTMIMIIVTLGVMVNERGQIDGAARDAARAGSLQGDENIAGTEAKKAADADLGTKCQGSNYVTGTYQAPTGPGHVGYYRVTISCTIDMTGYGVFGAHQTFTSTFSAPIDPLQNFVPNNAPATTPSTTPSTGQ